MKNTLFGFLTAAAAAARRTRRHGRPTRCPHTFKGACSRSCRPPLEKADSVDQTFFVFFLISSATDTMMIRPLMMLV